LFLNFIAVFVLFTKREVSFDEERRFQLNKGDTLKFTMPFDAFIVE